MNTRHRALPLASAVLAAVTSTAVSLGAPAASVDITMASDPSNPGGGLGASLMIRVTTPDSPGDDPYVDFTLMNAGSETNYFSAVSIFGGPLGAGRLVSSEGSRHLWGRRNTEAEQRAAGAGQPGIITAGDGNSNSGGHANLQTLTFRYALTTGATLETVIDALGASPTQTGPIRIGVRMSPWGGPGGNSEGDWYGPASPLIVPLPYGAFAGCSTLAALMGLMYVRRRSHASR